MKDYSNGLVDGVPADRTMVRGSLFLHFEPNTNFDARRLCPQRRTYAHGDPETQVAYRHRCHEVLIYVFARVLSLYGIPLREAIKLIRSILIITNIIPTVGKATWTKGGLPEDYLGISKATKPLMQKVFKRFPSAFPNLDKVFVFGAQANDARDGILHCLDGLLYSVHLVHPENHVTPRATEAQQLSLLDAASNFCANLLGVEQISLRPEDDQFKDIFILARFTGSDTPQRDEAWDYFLHSTSGSHDERLAMVESRFDRNHRDGIAARLDRTVTRTFERDHLPRLLAIKQTNPDTKMVSETKDMRRENQEYNTAYKYISGLRKRYKNGGLQSGEDKIIDTVEGLGIPIRNEADVEEARKGAQSDMSSKRHKAESNAFAKARNKKKGKKV